MAEQAPPDNVQEPIAEASVEPSTPPVLPEKIRVHALAKLLGVTSKQVLAEAAAFGTELRSAHSSLPREIAERIHLAVSGAAEPSREPETLLTEASVAESQVDAAVSTDAAADAAVKPASRKRTRKKAAPEAETASEPDTPAETGVNPAHVEVETTPGTDVLESSSAGLFTDAVFDRGQAQEPPPTAATAAMEAPLFLQPEPVVAEPAPRRRSRRGAAAPEPADEQQAEATEETGADDAEETAGSAGSTEATSTEAPSTEATPTETEGGDQQRRRRRGRRGRGRGRGEQPAEGAESGVSQEGPTDGGVGADGTSEIRDSSQPTGERTEGTEPGSDVESGEVEQEESDQAAEGTSRRRRRRRRRKGGAEGGEVAAEDDPPNTVVHEREPRNKARAKDEVQGITGSTRLEAKRQRRRDGRDAGRRRPPILSESEFLARRESVDRVMVVRERVNGANPAASTQVAVLEDGVLVEHFVTGSSSASMVGNVYLGRVQNVLPSMEAAFIDIGRGRNGVLYAGEVNWEAAGLGGKERKIEQALKPGDQVLVQVSKDPVGHKGARLTTQISLAGRFLVYVPKGSSTGISRKLPDTERKRLKEILREIVPADAGVIIRTASEGVSEEELSRDVNRLQTEWTRIQDQADKAQAKGSGSPQALYEEPDLLVKVVRDLFNEDFSKLVIEGEKAWTTVEAYIKNVAPDLLPRAQRHDPEPGTPDVFETHRIDEQLAKALDRKVWLPSGGTLVIDRTEAMTVIDVNTGKFTGSGGNLEETVTRNNLEAAEEIVRQMRLRDIGGMIVVDFIDMVLESNRDLVLRRLTEALSRDRTRHQVSEVTSLGLVQMTRKKLGTGLVEAFSTTCEHCHGRGIVVHSDPIETKSGDDGRGQAKESGSRKKRGRDRATAAAQEPATNGQHAHQTPEEAAADASVKRAHPVALAMASHHADDHMEDSESDAVKVESDAVKVESDAVKVESDTGDVDSDAAKAGIPQVEGVEAEAEHAEADQAEAERVEARTAEAEEREPDTTEAEPEAAPKPRARRRSRRVSRAAAAPTGEASDAGTVFVIPVLEPTSQSMGDHEVEPQAAPTPPAPSEAVADADVQVVRRPRRRRAAARPAGPPTDTEA
ncbi:translation initiation factor IF-2 N-terminal domain-containing protein [Rhodococcus xishaensis]|uniref:Ribonuclease E n=1 Tax=Rhodococcus xishaensis TaxID=2487364 RepID=A0A3S3APP3_9NOCA|nr:translation initiation factor IF-2 N-terminal domain-containing protein [Rhodococcus xishaensis]RVW05507.1 Rne/Rng family ribonuclease [Rhodococcus xishaensis]